VIGAVIGAFLRARRKWSTGSLARHQATALEAQLRFLRRASPHYRDALARGGFETLPILTKPTWMALFDVLNTRGLRRDEALEIALRSERLRDFAPRIGDVSVGLSSGTSGTRGLFVASAAERRAWAGYVLGRLLPSVGRPERIAFFLRANNHLYMTLGVGPLRFHYLDLSRPWEELVAEVQRFAPTIVVAPPRALVRLAGEGVVAPRQVVSVADVLHDDERELLARWAPRVDQVYQATEGLLGSTCSHGTIHLHDDLLLVEREELGEGRFVPIVTDLYRRTQPVVRYRLDDVLRLGSCPCGDARTALAGIEGRRDDLVVIDGRSSRITLFPDDIRRAVLLHSDPASLRVEVAPGRITVATLPHPLPGREEAAEALRALWNQAGAAAPIVQFDRYVPRPLDVKERRVVVVREATAAAAL
jgi:putative adenylate-forming enzyme